MMYFMAALSGRYSLQMPHCTLWHPPSVGGGELIWADQQSFVLLDVLGTGVGPEIDFSPYLYCQKKKKPNSEIFYSHCWHIVFRFEDDVSLERPHCLHFTFSELKYSHSMWSVLDSAISHVFVRVHVNRVYRAGYLSLSLFPVLPLSLSQTGPVLCYI